MPVFQRPVRLDGTEIPSPEEMRARRVAAARAEPKWVEYDRDELRPRGGLLAATDGNLYARCKVEVFFGGDPRYANNVHAVAAFHIDAAGDVVFLSRPGPGQPQTVDELNARSASRAAEHEAREREQFQAEQKQLEYLRSQPTRVLTLGDMMRRDLPTVRQAAEMILAVGSIEAHGDNVVIRIPEKLTRRPDSAKREAAALEPFADAAMVLLGAREIVLGALESDSKKPLAERLPDTYVAADGGMAA